MGYALSHAQASLCPTPVHVVHSSMIGYWLNADLSIFLLLNLILSSDHSPLALIRRRIVVGMHIYRSGGHRYSKPIKASHWEALFEWGSARLYVVLHLSAQYEQHVKPNCGRSLPNKRGLNIHVSRRRYWWPRGDTSESDCHRSFGISIKTFGVQLVTMPGSS